MTSWKEKAVKEFRRLMGEKYTNVEDWAIPEIYISLVLTECFPEDLPPPDVIYEASTGMVGFAWKNEGGAIFTMTFRGHRVYFSRDDTEKIKWTQGNELTTESIYQAREKLFEFLNYNPSGASTECQK